MAEYLTKYGYAPDQEAMGRALELIASNLDKLASEQVYKDCFSMMDLTTLKTDDTPASVTKLVNKVNSFRQSYPEWPLPASVCVYPNFAATVKEARACDFNITVVSACFPSSQSFLEVKLKECEIAVDIACGALCFFFYVEIFGIVKGVFEFVNLLFLVFNVPVEGGCNLFLGEVVGVVVDFLYFFGIFAAAGGEAEGESGDEARVD